MATATLDLDTDLDGVTNSVDIDDDNDGILDVDEAGPEIINGSFELNVTGTGFNREGDDVFGWTVTSGNVDTWVNANATDGSRILDINGSTAGAIQQSITTVAGLEYQILFDYLASNQSATINLIDDATGDVIETLLLDEPSGGFSENSISFTASGAVSYTHLTLPTNREV